MQRLALRPHCFGTLVQSKLPRRTISLIRASSSPISVTKMQKFFSWFASQKLDPLMLFVKAEEKFPKRWRQDGWYLTTVPNLILRCLDIRADSMQGRCADWKWAASSRWRAVPTPPQNRAIPDSRIKTETSQTVERGHDQVHHSQWYPSRDGSFSVTCEG